MHRFLIPLLILMIALPARAQRLMVNPVFDAPGVTFRADVPTPEAVLGFSVGARHARPEEIMAYARAVDAASERVRVEEIARSYEGRPLVAAYVTHPDNHARLESIRQANLRLSDAPALVSDADLRAMPAIVYMGFSVHGNEASGADAALAFLYYLAAAEGPAAEAMLRNTVVIVDPLLNPDGRARFTNWVERMRGGVPVADPQDLEHAEPWPGGRTNHYWFDLNRDWLPVLHPETAGRFSVFHRWRPQLFTDHHEQGGEATYFFQPGVPARTNPNTPAINQELAGRVAQFHARALDRIGSLYFTRENYDDFYYGKASTYPDVNGAVGILFEQASSRALVVDTRTHGRLWYGFTVRNQLATSLSTVEAAVAMREDLLRFQRDAYRSAPSDARRLAGAEGYVFGEGGDPVRAALLVDLLGKHRIRVHRLARAVEAEGTRFQPGTSFVVPLDQPQARLVRGLFERPRSFTDSLFYDISAWTVPLAYGQRLGDLRSTAGIAGAVVESSGVGPGETVPGRLVGGRAGYAYALRWGSFFAPRGLYRLLEKGVRVRVFKQPSEAVVDGQREALGRGTLFVALGGQEVPADTIHALVARMTREDGVEAFALGTGLAAGGVDLGTPSATTLQAPRLALVVGEGTDAGNAGEVWHLLSERMRIPVSLLDVRRLGTYDLSRYTTLLMTGGTYPATAADPVKAFVQNGGTLVATTEAAANGLATLTPRTAGSRDSLLRSLPYAEVADARGSGNLSGALFDARVDTTHPLGYGLPERLTFFREGSTFHAVPNEAGVTVARFTNDPLAAGYLPATRRAQVRGALAAAALRQGRGRVVLLPDNPAFRGFWLGTSALFMNAVMLSDVY
jgi:hypothetical protein